MNAIDNAVRIARNAYNNAMKEDSVFLNLHVVDGWSWSSLVTVSGKSYACTAVTRRDLNGGEQRMIEVMPCGPSVKKNWIMLVSLEDHEEAEHVKGAEFH